ncbi:MAG: betaine-aldehyde dehydrogenase [Chloroflexota bacterium]|nr:betaine-aldehyde dehydrogenase [Chloroflexota bacterium]
MTQGRTAGEAPDLLNLSPTGRLEGTVPFSVGGRWREAASGATFETYAPGTGRLIGRVADAGEDDLELAVEAARSVAPAWAAMAVAERAELITELGRRVAENAEALGMIDAIDNGSPLTAMTADAVKGANSLKLAGLLGYELKGHTYPISGRSLHYTTLEPWGVVARIIAFNHPTLFACARLAPALAAGNVVILKPSELAPLGALAMAGLASDIFPPGVLSVLTGGPGLGRAIAAHPVIRRLSFTGSVATGLAVMRETAESGVIKSVTYELGGKNPIIVFPDADLDAAARAVVRGMNFTRVQGQSCGSTSRLLVHRDVHRQVVDLVVELAGAIRIGLPTDPATEMGSLINIGSQERCTRMVGAAVGEGARLVLGGTPPADPELEGGAYFLPTVLDDVPVGAEVSREEVFGPVLSVTPWSSEDEAIDQANALRFGLTASVWTADIDAALRSVQRLEAGYIWVNDVETRYLTVPFGGWKDSGAGLEQGLDEVLSFTRMKSVNVTIAPQ